MIFSADDIQGLPNLEFVNTRADLNDYIGLLQSVSDFDLGLQTELDDFIVARGDGTLYLDSHSNSSVVIDSDFVGETVITSADAQIFSTASENQISIGNSQLIALIDPDFEQSFNIDSPLGTSGSSIWLSSAKQINSSLIDFDQSTNTLTIGKVEVFIDLSNIDVVISDPDGFTVRPSDLVALDNTEIESDIGRVAKQVQQTPDLEGGSSVDDLNIEGLGDDLLVSDEQLAGYIADTQTQEFSAVVESSARSEYSRLSLRSDARFIEDSDVEFIIDGEWDSLAEATQNLISNVDQTTYDLLEITDGEFISNIVWDDDLAMLDGLI